MRLIEYEIPDTGNFDAWGDLTVVDLLFFCLSCPLVSCAVGAGPGWAVWNLCCG